MYGYYYGTMSAQGMQYYLLLVVPALIISIIAQVRVKSAYKKMSRVMARTGITGAEAAARILAYHGVTGVGIGSVGGKLTDHYNPRTNVIHLSEGVYMSNSVAAIGIACHEAGHAVQHAQGYVPIKLRNMILPVCKIGSYAGVPIALVGYFLGLESLVFAGLLLYSAILLFQVVTLPVEIDASRRAIECIENMGLVGSEEELRGVKKVLTAAAMTYLASIAVSAANLLRLLLLFTGKKK